MIPFRDRDAAMAAHYSGLAKRHGDSPRSAQWRGSRSQDRRIEVLLDIADLSSAKILDFGCGTARLYALLSRRCEFKGEYVGYDLSEGMLAIARRKFPGLRIEKRNIFESEDYEMFDYVFASGTFNNDHDEARVFFERAVPRLFAMCRHGMAFNALSAWAPRQTAQLIYLDPIQVYDWARRTITPLATLRHDYRIEDEDIPEDFTIYLRRHDIPI